jgi:hypothetical protein
MKAGLPTPSAKVTTNAPKTRGPQSRARQRSMQWRDGNGEGMQLRTLDRGYGFETLSPVT